MAFPTKQDHVEIGLGLMLSQWERSPKVLGLLQSYLEEMNVIEEVLFEIVDETGVLIAEGVNLDLIGELVNEERSGEDDTSYRNRILNKISSRNISGTPDEVMSVLTSLSGATESTIFEHYPASFIPRLNVEYNSILMERLQRIKPAGVRADQILFAPFEDSVVPSELEFSQSLLVNENLDNISTDNLDDILIQQSISPPDSRAILIELDDNEEQAEFGSNNEVGLFGDPSLEAAKFGEQDTLGTSPCAEIAAI